MRALVAVPSLLLVLNACVPVETRVAARESTPEELVLRVRRAAREEEWGDIHDRLSRSARERVARIPFLIGFPTYRLPPPHGYKLADVVAYGRCDGVLPDPENPGRAIVFYSYHETGKPRLDAEVLIVREDGAWRIEGPRQR